MACAIIGLLLNHNMVCNKMVDYRVVVQCDVISNRRLTV
jgi:hypothetical protein